jgi:hypothetical protein
LELASIIEEFLKPRVTANIKPNASDKAIFALFFEFGSILGQIPGAGG